MVFKTIECKLKTPSAAKKRIIDSAIERYTCAFQFLLKEMEPRLCNVEAALKNGGGSKVHRAVAEIPSEVSDKLNDFMVTPFKDAIKMDYAITAISYLGLRGNLKDARYPTVRLDDEEFAQTMSKAIGEYDGYKISKNMLDCEIYRAMHKYNAQKSLLFCRYAKNRDYCLLYDENKRRFYVKMYLLGVKDTNREKKELACDGKLQYVSSEHEYLEADYKARRYIIVPLTFGNYQKEFLLNALKEPKTLKTARLSCRNKEYYLAICVACPTPNVVKTRNFCGIARGLDAPLHYTVTNRNGQKIASGMIGDKKDGDIFLHRASKDAAALAKKWCAQTIVMNCRQGKTDRLRHSEKKTEPILSQGQYLRFCDLLSYKLQILGLPTPISVSPNGLYCTCPSCGLNALKNRFNARLMICTSCGYLLNIDELGSLNLANRVNLYKKDPILFQIARIDDKYCISNREMGIEYKLNAYDPEEFFAYLEAIRLHEPSCLGLDKDAARLRLSLYSKLADAENVREIVIFQE